MKDLITLQIVYITLQINSVTVDAYSNEQERIDMDAWNLTALTFMHVDEWKTFFKEEGYYGDYYWFIP